MPRWQRNYFDSINTYKQRAKTLKELVLILKRFINEPASYAQEDITQWITPATVKELEEIADRIEQIELFLKDTICSR